MILRSSTFAFNTFYTMFFAFPPGLKSLGFNGPHPDFQYHPGYKGPFSVMPSRSPFFEHTANNAQNNPAFLFFPAVWDCALLRRLFFFMVCEG